MKENFSASRAKIASDLKISPPTVSKIIDELIIDGYVLEIGKHQSTGGKKAIKLGFNSKSGSVIGVDLGKDRIRIARSDFGGQILEKHVGFKIYFKDRDLLEKVIKEIQEFVAGIKSGNNGKNGGTGIKGMCLGIPADIDSRTGVILSSPLFAEWKDLNLKDIFSRYFDFEIFIENSKNMSAIGEKNLGTGKEHENFVILEIGEGIGAGIILKDQLYRGSSFSAGEAGFLIQDKKQLYSTYKIKGAMEKIASPNVLKREILEFIHSGGKTIVADLAGNDLNKITPSAVCEAALLNDKASKKIITYIVESLAVIVSNLILILNPEIIVIGGDILELPEVDGLFVNPIKKLVKNVVPFNLPLIEKASLGVDAGVLGCSIFAINNILNSLYPYKV